MSPATAAADALVKANQDWVKMHGGWEAEKQQLKEMKEDKNFIEQETLRRYEIRNNNVFITNQYLQI